VGYGGTAGVNDYPSSGPLTEWDHLVFSTVDMVTCAARKEAAGVLSTPAAFGGVA